MIFTETNLHGLFEIKLTPLQDNRGWFARTFCQQEFEAHGLACNWVQLNHSYTKHKGTVRGLHYQNAPHAETKLIRCIQGEVWDVAVDLRKKSPTYLQWRSCILSAQNKTMYYLPQGFAHGFQAITDNAELIYHHTALYTPHAEAGLNYMDKTLNIQWTLPPLHVSERDLKLPYIDTTFEGLL